MGIFILQSRCNLSFLPMVFCHFHNSHISLISPYPTSYKLAWEVSLNYVYIYKAQTP